MALGLLLGITGLIGVSLLLPVPPWDPRRKLRTLPTPPRCLLLATEVGLTRRLRLHLRRVLVSPRQNLLNGLSAAALPSTGGSLLPPILSHYTAWPCLSNPDFGPRYHPPKAYTQKVVLLGRATSFRNQKAHSAPLLLARRTISVWSVPCPVPVNGEKWLQLSATLVVVRPIHCSATLTAERLRTPRSPNRPLPSWTQQSEKARCKLRIPHRPMLCPR